VSHGFRTLDKKWQNEETFLHAKCAYYSFGAPLQFHTDAEQKKHLFLYLQITPYVNIIYIYIYIYIYIL